MEFMQTNTPSAVDIVRNALESDIMRMHFAPGAKLTENELSVRYGISRNTIREAVAHLLSQGLLTKVANRGVFVRSFTVTDVEEIFHLRTLLELEAVNSIISARSTPSDLYKLVERMEQTDRQTNWDSYVHDDILFHSSLVSAANSPRLSKLYETILTEVKLCIYQTRNYVQLPTATNNSHRQLLDAICAHDLHQSLELMQIHIENVIKRYCSGLIAMEHAE